MRKSFICGLDIGSFKICATCGTVGPSGKIDILATQTVPAQGIEAGRIVDSKKLSAAIKDVAYRLRKASRLRLQRVYANIDTPDLRAKVCKEKLSFEKSTKIKKIHIEKLISSTISSHLSLARRLIHTGFRNFVIDKRTNSIYPEGCSAQELKLNMVIVSVPLATINRFVKCIKDAGLTLEGMFSSGYAQSLSFFRDFRQDREKNNILIDVGSTLTKISLFEGGLLKDMRILPLGAESITEDIAAKLKISLNCAEELKKKYGRVFSENKSLGQKIIVKDKLRSKVMQLKRLYEIITLKVDYLLQEMKKALTELSYEDKKVTEIIFTGGGAILEGFLERAEKILGKATKLGFLYAVKNRHIQAQSAFYATSIGLMRSGFKNRRNKSFYLKAKVDPFMRLFNQARKLYREYF